VDKLLFPFIWLLKKSRIFSALSCRLTQLTGKSKYPIHPKHLVEFEKPWYLNDIKKNDVVLDLGCGNGQQSLKIARKVKKIIGVDYDKRQLSLAEKIAKDKNIKNIKFLSYDLEKKLPFKNSSFDKILCLDILEHLNKRKQFLEEIKRILKQKGNVFLSVPNNDTSWKKLQRKAGLNYYTDPDHKREYSLKEIKLALSRLGFEILDIKPIVYDTPFSGLIDLVGGISLEWYKKLSLWKKNKVEDGLKESAGFRIKIKKMINR
jgi:2-polyprenyl-3-methyl-5-hydroxy-6-metoxy-1,4-benzoquinol methylase